MNFFSFKLNYFLKAFNEKSAEIFTDCSYTMYILIKCLDLVLIEVMNRFERDHVNVSGSLSSSFLKYFVFRNLLLS
jgi:hypothetical protein